MADDEVTLTELAEQTGESARTLRFYVMQGLLRGPDASGPRARYPFEYVARVRWIRERQSEGLSLGRIARDLQALDAAGLPLPLPPWCPRPPRSTRLPTRRAAPGSTCSSPTASSSTCVVRSIRSPNGA